ncbi:hypothetical protein [Embleya sp. NBC_00896]|uniref:hypothetical protein n=1 Tax=Embleya sp. NBC_00896 TaxID=2975961 RepID=UPI00386A4E81|nr:hypothetical protein OG928_24550 [Embleya sp. NBC_00896]
MTSAGDFAPYPSPEGAHVGFAPGSSPQPGLWRRYRADVVAFAAVVAACLAVGVLVGLVWEQITPRVPLLATEEGVFQTSPETETSIALDGWFAVCGVVAGIVLAPLAFWRFRRQGVATALALTVGGLAGGYLAFKIGVWLGPDEIMDQVRRIGLGKRFDQPLELKAKGVLLLWPIASMVIFLGLCAGFAPADRDEAPSAGPYGWPPAQQPGGQGYPWSSSGASSASPSGSSSASPVDLAKPDAESPSAVDLTKRDSDER